MMIMRKKIVCADGFDLSVQASEFHYCSPRDDDGPYTKVEVGFPSAEEELLLPHIEGGKEPPTESVYPWTPIEVVYTVIEKHGGMVSGELPVAMGPGYGEWLDEGWGWGQEGGKE